MRTRIDDVARHAGVSLKTVSRVLNNSPLVRDDTRERVRALMQQRGYEPDPQARGLIAGLDMARDVESLIALYVATLTGLGYGLRQIIAASRAQGAQIEAIVLSGGAGRHPLVRQLLADAADLPVEIPGCPEPVLLGAAILGATAAGTYPDVRVAMAAMSHRESRILPAGGAIAALHAARFEAFETLQRAETKARNLMAAARNGETR